MFNHKKQEIARLNTLLDGYRKAVENWGANNETLKEENAALTEANGKLKRDLDLEIRQKQELSDQLAETAKKLKNAEWREQHFKSGNKTEPRPTCPDDCAHRANPGPGGSICRNCIRNPRAVDKYEKAGDADA